MSRGKTAPSSSYFDMSRVIGYYSIFISMFYLSERAATALKVPENVSRVSGKESNAGLWLLSLLSPIPSA